VQAYQVPEESSHQIADPPTLEPELGLKEAENVEYSTVGGRVMMEEEDGAEISLSNHSSLMVRQNTFKEERIAMVEEVTNENHMKCISRTGCSSPSFSLKLTQLVSMAGAEDDEVDSEMQSQPEDMVNIYQVKPELMPILRKIIGKHGDIAKNCVTKSVKFRSAFLEMICEIISDLDKKHVANIKGNDLKIKIGEVNDIKNLKVEVEWLHTRLTEILEARQILKQSGTLKDKKDSIRKFIEIAKSELKECEAEKKRVTDKLRELSEKLKAVSDKEADWKERLTRMQDESTKTSQRVKDVKSKVRRFLDCSLIDGLL